MKKPDSKSFSELREYIETVPVIDTHEHYIFGTKPFEIKNILEFVTARYLQSDLQSVSPEAEKVVMK